MGTQIPLILTQYRNNSEYRDFLGHLYHFPQKYLNNFINLPTEFILYEPIKSGKGEYYGCGIVKEILKDNEKDDHYFAIIEEFQLFNQPVFYKDEKGKIIESKSPFYNSQNAVRFLPQNIFDEICLEGGISLRFKSDSHLIKVLGEQLIGSERVGILELIKNAIDAQATYCRVRLEKISVPDSPPNPEYEFPEYEGPVIVIEDDGIGMSLDILKNGWLRPASTIKTNIKEQIKKERTKALESGNLGTFDALIKKIKKEHGDRIPLGEKGVGRFATHRLGRNLLLKTKTADSPYEIVLSVDWDKFDIRSSNFVDLDTIGIEITKQDPSWQYGESESGTQLIIYGGREGFRWDENAVKDLNMALLSLNSPDSRPQSPGSHTKTKYGHFNAYLECPQIEDLPTTLIFEESIPNFSLDVLVNDEGMAEYYLDFRHPTDKIPQEKWGGKIDLIIQDRENPTYWRFKGEKRTPSCGAFDIHMDIWYRKSEWIDIPNSKELTDYLGEFGGMSIYRDNILIFDSKLGSELDWLKLNEKRIKQAFKISYRDFIGRINIDQEVNIYLEDKTNREGLVKNQAFLDLATLARNAIETILLPGYIGKRNEFTKLTKGIITNPTQLSYVTKLNSSLISNISESEYPFDEDPFSFFSDVWDKVKDRKEGLVNLQDSIKELQKSINLIEEVQEQFIEQAGFGIAVAISLHEINKITTNFYNSILEISKRQDFNNINIQEIRDTAKSLKTELKRLGPLRAIRNEEKIEFNILRSIRFASEVYKRRLQKSNISFKILNPENDFDVYGRYSALNQVFGNLFDNSIYWIENASQKESQIIIRLDKNNRSVIFADSGTDIHEIIRPYLFQPGYSLKIPKSGLGLYICKSYLDSMKARIYESPTKDRIANLPGAHFTLDFGRTPENREEL